jgi:DNA-binding beta-propeller fold protein YncE
VTSASIISTVAGDGTGTAGYTGDGGPATSAQLNGPANVAVDSSGNLYIADLGNNCVRKVVFSPPSNLTATAMAMARIDFAWQDNSSNETGSRLTDGELGDSTGVDGHIVDPGGVVYP